MSAGTASRPDPMTGLRFNVTFFKDYAAARKHEEAWTLASLANRINTVTASEKERLPWLKLARFGDTKTEKGSLRHDENLHAISGIEADYDGEQVPFTTAVETLEKAGVLAMVYTSPSHTEAAPRWRVLCPTSTELPPTQREKLMGRLNGLLRGIFSVESWTLSQSYYFGSVRGSSAHQVQLVDGTPLDEHDELDETWQGKPQTSQGARPRLDGGPATGRADPAALLAEIVSGAAYHAACVRLLGVWARGGVPFLEARTRLLAAFDGVPDVERGERWRQRRGDVDRCLEDIYGKDAKQKDAGEQKPLHQEKRPLFRPMLSAPEFPLAALGPLRDPADAIRMRAQAPIAMCGNSVLAAATLAVQAHRDVELPGGGRKPLTAIYVSVADSGERKTTVDKLALAPVYRMEEAWRAEYDGARQQHANDHEAWKAARDTAKKKAKGNRAGIRAALDAIGPEPKPPPHPMLLVADPTPEALVLHLRDSRPWAGVFTAEGGILVGGAAFNDESRMRTGALFNTLWDAEPIRRTRVGTGAAYLPGRRCTAHVMLQPVVADKLFGDPMLDGIGMLARTLLVAPESTAGTRMYRATPSDCITTLAAYAAQMDTLLRRPPATKPDDPSVLDPPVLRLHPDAARVWIAFHDAAEAQLLPGGEFATIKAFGAKLAEHAGRLAAVLTVFADPDAEEVPVEMMENGVDLAKYYAAEMLRLQGANTVSSDLRLAARLLIWWQARPDRRCHLAGVYQRGLNALGDAATARRIVGILEEHGWVRQLPAGTEIDGAPRREAWELVP